MARKATTMRTSRNEKMIAPKELHGNGIQPNRKAMEANWQKVAAGGARGRGAKRDRRTRIRARIANGTVYTSYTSTIARADAFGEDG